MTEISVEKGFEDRQENVAISSDHEEYTELLTRFDAKRQKELLRKIDWRLLPLLTVFYLLSFMDRSNMGNARLQGLERDLQMTPTQYNLCLTIFFIPYGLFEVPSNLALKFTKPSFWLPFLMASWGLVMMCMGWVHNYAGLLSARFFLGVAEAGLFPGATYLCSTWYLRKELQFRIALFYTAASLAGSFSGLLAYGIGFMEGIRGYGGWRWLFILEGLLTIVVALVSIPFICDAPDAVGWLTDEEKRFVQLRLQFDGHERGYTETRYKPKYLKQAFLDLKVYLGCILFTTCCTGTYSLSYSLPTTIKLLGYSAANAQLLTVPIYAFACVVCVVNAVVADKLQRRFQSIIIPFLLGLCGFIICLTVSPTEKPGVIYFAMFLVASGLFPTVPGIVCWISNNLAGQWKRSIGMALEFTLGNLIGGVVGSNIFLSGESPEFRSAYLVLASIFSVGILTTITNLFVLVSANRKDAKSLKSLSPAELERFHEETKDDGDKSPFFKYTL
ncbi:MFS general substrate transporter [Eremomyces bilateralis CBS 781.70]|uniref:MFS general substrate transporter n=1 Tax=Eremomyces bilateralis CBS 781.70 TaxID=1392243 RepID=A0A6G1FU74_9PEZI|nr:MFS general substrate transporter [Eremomyces bilateralis CBS 781.70]KAF1809219.1 MFS general substrate transporter [Eremomyces bilateralis CBS 781.70]